MYPKSSKLINNILSNKSVNRCLLKVKNILHKIKPKKNKITNQINAKKNLVDAIQIMTSLGVHWWLEAGTCLGAIREGNFIGYDRDIDIGVFGTEKVNEIKKEFKSKGFKLYHAFGKPENGYEISLIRNDVKLDIFFFYEDKNRNIWWHSAWLRDKQLFLDFNKYLFTNLKEIDFLGIKVNVPNPPEKYLVERYGDNWRIPDKNWHWAFDPKCLRKDILK